MDHLTPEYFRQIEHYHRLSYPDEDTDVFIQEFRRIVAEDHILRAALAFVVEDPAPPLIKIKVSISFFKKYVEDEQRYTSGTTESDEDSDSDREDFTPQEFSRFDRLVQLTRTETVSSSDLEVIADQPSTSSMTPPLNGIIEEAPFYDRKYVIRYTSSFSTPPAA